MKNAPWTSQQIASAATRMRLATECNDADELRLSFMDAAAKLAENYAHWLAQVEPPPPPPSPFGE